MTPISGILLLIGCCCQVISTDFTKVTANNDASFTLSPDEVNQLNHAIGIVEFNFTSKEFCKVIVTQIIESQTSVERICHILCLAKGELWTAQGCNFHDYDLLKNVLCDSYTCTTSAPVLTTTLTPEQKKISIQNLRCVVDNQLSSVQCMQMIRNRMEGEDDPDRACNTLKSVQYAFSLFHCTTEDYNKLHNVICQQKIVRCLDNTSLTENPVKLIEDAVYIINSSFTSEQSCKTTVLTAIQTMNSVEGSCQMLCTVRGGVWENQKCNVHDYNLLMSVLCMSYTCTVTPTVVVSTQSLENDVSVTPTAAPSLDFTQETFNSMHNALVLVNSSFTSEQSCKDRLISIIKAQTSVEGFCQILCLAKGALWSSQNCNVHDYDLLKNGVCGYYNCATPSPMTMSTTSPENEVSVIVTNSTSDWTSLSPELVKLMEHGVELVISSFTSDRYCKDIVISIIQSQTSVEETCQVICMARGALWALQNCNAHDYDLLKNGLCGTYTCANTREIFK